MQHHPPGPTGGCTHSCPRRDIGPQLSSARITATGRPSLFHLLTWTRERSTFFRGSGRGGGVAESRTSAGDYSVSATQGDRPVSASPVPVVRRCVFLEPTARAKCCGASHLSRGPRAPVTDALGSRPRPRRQSVNPPRREIADSFSRPSRVACCSH